ncbi:ABC transporter permease [Stakelama saccharophila]|uniref:ABC transporter permease n=1 Tax=Stakelama saccharophila TaxID=3075605 RepID=A0ABZ0BB64_9SPHN|nr:ABC transporter permease [Stakelama sp. W311]WNO54510.1 ABC transporter permease [Stakelama sp. W311]
MRGFFRMVRDTLTVARRDFMAMVGTPTFLLFLLAPVLMVGFGAIGGAGGAMVGKNAEAKQRIYAVIDSADAARFAAVDKRLRAVFTDESEPIEVGIVAPAGDPAQQARALLNQDQHDVPAVLYGSLTHPNILHRNEESSSARYLAEVAEQAVRDEAAGITAPISSPRFVHIARQGSSIGGKSATGFFAVTILFVLSLMLSGQTVGTMAEERSNKVIEILAASVRLESVFLGKLIGMFGVAMVFIAFWGALVLLGTLFVPNETLQGLTEMRPAIGIVPFAFLFFGYFTMAYLLLGSVFLGIGAQASTPREIQMLSLPITVFQMAMLGLASASVALPDQPVSLVARIFPFSSPFAMLAYAARSPAIWPHLLAFAWQLLWVGLSISLGARFFRFGVLKSAGPRRKKRWGRKQSGQVAATSS